MKELNYFLILFAKMVHLNFKFFSEIFKSKFERTKNNICNFINENRSVLKHDLFLQENLFQKACDILDYDFHFAFLQTFLKEQEEFHKKRNNPKNTPDKLKNKKLI